MTVAVIAALGALTATTVSADPLLTVKLFRDSDVMFRDSDMSRWSENYVELGAGYNSQNSLRFGQFTGLTDKGGFPLAGFNWLSRNEANDAQYWLVHGSNLGLDSRKIQVQGGVQGQWNASLSFEGLKKSQTESAQFYHNGLGTSNLTLRGATAANPTAINTALLQAFEIQHGRDIYRIGLNALVNKEWDFKINYREDRRDGTRLTGVATTFIAGRGQAMIVPYQIDDKTQQIEAVLAYTAKDAQFQIGYHYSRFENALDKFDVQNPFSSAAGNLNQRLSLAPDNDYHQINATGAYRFSKTTRLNATYSYGIARQNQAFLPYSVNGTTAATSTTAGLPRSSLDGKVINTLFDVALTSKPLDKMNLKVGFQYRDSDNRTPIAQYAYVSRDLNSAAVCAPGAATGSCIRSNAPVSTTEKRLVVDGDYEIAPKTLLRASLDHSDKKYTLADRTDTQTDKLTIELRKPVADDLLGSLGYIYTQRRGSSYDKNVYFRNTYTDPAFQGATGLTNNPSMRQFMWADFDENRIRASGSWAINETLNLQGVAETYKQKMRGPNCGQFANPLEQVAITGGAMSSSTCLGRDTADGGSLSVDLQYQPEENLTTFAFANISQTGVKQIGRTWSATNASGGFDTKNWYGDILNRDHTLGFGLKWQPEEKWDMGGTYVVNHSVGKSGINQAASGAPGPVVAASTPVPDTWNKLHTLQLFAKWDYSKQLSWRFNYLYENLKSYDWALNDVGATSNVHVLFTGQQAPRYSNHVFGVSAVVKHF
jgi:MtrB/PioB family decaheme-associated outer membrane protein